MGVLYDYFRADSDEEAAAVVEWGPRGPAPAPPAAPAKRGLFRRRAEPPAAPPPAVDPPAVFDTVTGNGIDPTVMLGTLEELLTGRGYDDVVADHRSGTQLAVRDDGARLVLSVTDTLAAALAAATRDRLAEVAVPWVETEEFWGRGEPAAAEAWLGELAELARRARTHEQGLYCWVRV